MNECPDNWRMASNDSDDDYIGHPLFPIPMDRVVTARRRFDLIQINRILPDKKTRETCRILFKGSELRSWQQILDMFGGECYYQLQGVCSKTRQYTARSERWLFRSPARKPFTDSVVLPPDRSFDSACHQEPPPAASPNLAITPEIYAELLTTLLCKIIT